MSDGAKVVYETVNDRWEVALTVSDSGFKQVSFVNSIATTKGGRHVDYVADNMIAKMIDVIKKKVGKSNVAVKPFQVCLFSCLDYVILRLKITCGSS